MNGVADQEPLGFGRREFRRKRHGFMGGEHEVEAGILPDMLAPVSPIVGPPRLKEGVELIVAGVGPDLDDAERSRDARRHIRPPVRPLAPAGIVGGQAFAGFEVPAADGDAVDLEGFGLGLVLGHIGADQRAFACGGDFGEVKHVRLVPAPLAGAPLAAAETDGSRRVTISRVWRMRPASAACWVISRDRRSAREGAFLFGPLRGQHFDHVGDEVGQGFDLSLKRISIHQKRVLRVIHPVDGPAQANEVVGDAGQVGVEGIAGRGSGHEHEPPVWKRLTRGLAGRGATGNGDAGEAERFAGVVFAEGRRQKGKPSAMVSRLGGGKLLLVLGPGPPHSGTRAVEEGDGSLHIVTNGVVELVQVLGRARLSFFRVVGHLLEEMDADALHFDGDDLSVDQRALEEPTLVVDLIALEADVAAVRFLVAAGLANLRQDGACDPFSESFGLGLPARSKDQTVDAEFVDRE